MVAVFYGDDAMNKPTHSLTARLQRLYKLHAFGIKFGLEAEAALLGCLGNPERELKKIIHVAGSNGKGSVCAFAEAILRAAGYKTGLYTSPHLVRVNERIMVNGKCITDEDLADLVELTDKCAAEYAGRAGGRQITFFEFITALAFEYFRRQKVEVLVLETGMGGRLDATNVTAPQVSIITSISLEHTKYLGPNLASIAMEKAGIIKQGVPVVVGNLPDEAMAVIDTVAHERDSRVIRAAQAVSVRRQKQTWEGQKISIESASNSYGTIRLPLLGQHQLANVAITVAALEEWCRVAGTELSLSAVKSGLSSVSWPGRFQVISHKPLTIIDGAHNPEAALSLNESLKELGGGMPVCLILGLCSDKDAAGFIRNITVPVSHCWVVALANERSLPPAELARHVKNKGWPFSIAPVPQALKEAESAALKNDNFICATGSFFLAGEIFSLKQNPDSLPQIG
jgi:dihydrofolate synthase/folylpolyglutamate synthase